MITFKSISYLNLDAADALNFLLI